MAFGRAKLPIMQKNKKLIRFVESFVLLPIMTVSGSVGGVMPQSPGIIASSKEVIVEKLNIELPQIFNTNEVVDVNTDKLEKELKAKAIDAYFEKRGMPLSGTGMKMVEEAEKNGLDWRLVAAIAVRESTGGKFACKRVPYNPFGWGSCRIGFKSNDHAIEMVAKNLGGNNPNTAYHYEDKDVIGILRAYNPPSIVPKYAEQVISIMNAIGEAEISLIENGNELTQS